MSISVMQMQDCNKYRVLTPVHYPTRLEPALLGLLLALLTLFRLPRLFRRLLCLNSLGAVVLRHWLHNGLLILGLDDGDGVWERLLRAGLALWVRAAHDLDLDPQNTLAKENVAGRRVDKVLGRLARVNHEAVLCKIWSGGFPCFQN